MHTTLYYHYHKKGYGTRTQTGQYSFTELEFIIEEEMNWSPPFQFTLSHKEIQAFETFEI